MKEHSNDRDKAEQSAHQRKNRGKGRAKRVWGVIGTIVLVGVEGIHGAVPSGDGRRDMGDVSDAVQR